MAWIKIDTSLSRHPKLVQLASMSHKTNDEVMGGLVRLWTWALEFALNGNLEKYKASLPTICGLESSHLVASGFLDEAPLRIHDWKEYTGEYLRIKNKGKKLNRLISKSSRKKNTTVGTTVAPPVGTTGKLSFSSPLISSPLSQDTTTKPKTNKNGNGMTAIQYVVKGWKIVSGIPEAGPESEAWDKVHFARHAKAAKSLLTLFNNDWEEAVDAMEFIYNHFREKKLSCTIETTVKHSDLFREFKEGRLVK